MKEVLFDTKSEVKLIIEISESFEIKTGVRQVHRQFQLLINCGLQKVIQEWHKQQNKQRITRISQSN